MGKWQKHKETSHIRETRAQPFPGRWSQSCKEQTRQCNKDKRETQIRKNIHKRSTALEQSEEILLEGQNMFHGMNITLNFDVEKDT